MVAHSRTADQILSTFLRLVAERGLDATTTRTLAEEAVVNEVTVFRRQAPGHRHHRPDQ